jgi:hypothetical protein
MKQAVIKGGKQVKKNRYLLCLLLTAFMLYFAVPRLPLHADGTAGIFSMVWLSFALIVIAGNLTALLYTPKKAALNLKKEQLRKKSRSFQ